MIAGWECQVQSENKAIKALEEKYAHLLENIAVTSIAAECPRYNYKPTAQNDDEPDNNIMTEEDLAQLRAISETEDLRRCTELGWYDPITKEFTDEYYQASNRAYDSRR